MTDREIREEVDIHNTVLASHETTASGTYNIMCCLIRHCSGISILISALGWTLYCLAIYKEHQELCPNFPIATTVCIEESLRLYPLVSFTAKLLSEDFVTNGNAENSHIYNHTIINNCLYNVHLNYKVVGGTWHPCYALWSSGDILLTVVLVNNKQQIILKALTF